ncbi:trypco2 family protein [Streptomyces sp. NPDC049577]|uniref:trypco2 family protein n=1 Tax=Streptomyces sp. NPDC049577 TaxID=3155153 RepID=UPI00344477D9
MSDVERFELLEFAAQLADEIRRVRDNPPPPGNEVIQLTECSIEMAMEVKKEAKGGIKVYVLELGGAVSTARTNKVILKFTPIDAVQMVSTQEGPGPQLGRGGKGS